MCYPKNFPNKHSELPTNREGKNSEHGVTLKSKVKNILPREEYLN